MLRYPLGQNLDSEAVISALFKLFIKFGSIECNRCLSNVTRSPFSVGPVVSLNFSSLPEANHHGSGAAKGSGTNLTYYYEVTHRASSRSRV